MPFCLHALILQLPPDDGCKILDTYSVQSSLKDTATKREKKMMIMDVLIADDGDDNNADDAYDLTLSSSGLFDTFLQFR